jgi:hypothetical protein
MDESLPDLNQAASRQPDAASLSDSRLTRSHLESLSTDELIVLADHFGMDIPPGLERVFLIEELLDIPHGGKLEPDGDLDGRPGFMEAVALPKQYNISYIEVMIRDPLWAFVFWEVKGHDREIHEKAPNFEGYCLRVVPLRADGGSWGRAFRPDRENSFTVPVGVNDAAWYLGFPSTEHQSDGAAGKDAPSADRWYQVALSARRGDEEILVTVSRPFKLPLLAPGRKNGAVKDTQGLYQNPLIRLSGACDFSVTRSEEHRSRVKGNSNSGFGA